MKIIIATGIYPPDIGGPAQYARETAKSWTRAGHSVTVCNFGAIRFLPTIVRHIAYFFWVLARSLHTDFIFIPDTFSAAVPAVAVGKILRKKTIIRTGGDFLWEQYVERTGDLVLLRNFYLTRMEKLNAKERLIFRLVGWAFRNMSAIVFSTAWQRDIFTKPYRLDLKKCFIVENYYGPCEQRACSDVLENIRTTKEKVFVGGTRPLKWKNLARVKEAFAKAQKQDALVVLQWETGSRGKFLLDIEASHAVIIASLGDISPNTILEAVQFGKPFILTRETGLYERLKDIAVWIDPENTSDIAEKVLWLADDTNYKAQAAKIRAFSFTHSWDEIANEVLTIYARD
ncbi:MAG: glycosyltransferase family 4 protein [bacterium]|nr:glycosyltransferase family 4 protein [bacterium]